jgi:hypothetical protein
MMSGALVLLSVASLGRFYFSYKPPGIDGNALAHLLAYGTGLEIPSFLGRAEFHSRFFPYAKSLLPVALVLMALLSAFSFHSSRSTESKWCPIWRLHWTAGVRFSLHCWPAAPPPVIRHVI